MLPPIASPHYLFIDGKHFDVACETLINNVFDATAEIDFALLRDELRAQKAFYYRCVDEAKSDGESEEAWKQRVEGEIHRLNSIQRAPGVHVREGTVRRGQRREEKEVDVMLAVDMMTHASSRNMVSATLVTGDLDFRPLVQGLLQLGIYVRILYRQRSGARDLLWAADESREINLEMVYSWSSDRFKAVHSIPNCSWDGQNPSVRFQNRGRFLKVGNAGDHKIELWQERYGDQIFFCCIRNSSLTFDCISHPKIDVLNRYVEYRLGPLKLQTCSGPG
jgi:uncharacterized LabA/DUF88 family protein